MQESEVRTITYPNGEIQRIQIVRFPRWDSAAFIRPSYAQAAFTKICSLYRDFIVPKKPIIFGQLVLFHLPEGCRTGLTTECRKFGSVERPDTAAAVTLRKGVRIIGGKPVFLTAAAKALWNELERADSVQIVRGKLPNTTILPVGSGFGFLSECEEDAHIRFNSSFFTMDRFDCASAYDVLGTPLGLCVSGGKVMNPPLFGREALTVGHDSSIKVRTVHTEDAAISIRGRMITGTIFSRPGCRKTPFRKGNELVIIGTSVAAVHAGGRTLVPASGFVLSPDCDVSDIRPGDSVSYSGFEDCEFAIQVGNSIIIDGIKTERFISPFYNIRRLWSIAYPPSLYPLDFDGARAPRMALGADRDGLPMLLWAEGPGKFGYDYGHESCGASLKEMAELCEASGMYNAVNLDGGGSAQILIDGKRSLLISDRNRADNTEAERAIPIGIAVRRQT